jgi:glycosyltransferase involved in cell wall biosynthesis
MRVGEVARLVEESGAGRVCSSTPEAFADAVDQILAIPRDLRGKLARTAAETWSWDRVATDLEPIYSRLVAAKRPGAATSTEKDFT